MSQFMQLRVGWNFHMPLEGRENTLQWLTLVGWGGCLTPSTFLKIDLPWVMLQVI